MGCLVVRIFPRVQLQQNKHVLPEIEHLKVKISDKELGSLKAVLDWNADVFSKHRADMGC